MITQQIISIPRKDSISIDHIAIASDELESDRFGCGICQHSAVIGIVAHQAAGERIVEGIDRTAAQAIDDIREPAHLQSLVNMTVPGQNDGYPYSW